MSNKVYRSVFFLVVALLFIFSAASVFGDDAIGQNNNAPNSFNEVTTAPLLIADNAKIIPNQYIVVFKKGASVNSVTSLADYVEAQGGDLVYQYGTALSGFAAVIPDKALENVRNNPNVDYVEADQIVSIDVTWGLDRIDQRNLPLNNVYSPGANGTGVRAYIIDTGILTSHNEFGGRANAAYTAVGGTPQDCNGHGTHVAGTVGGATYGVANNVTLYAVRVLDCSGSGTDSGVIAGVDWVTANRVLPAVANMSLGGGASTALDTAVSNSIASGVVYGIAGGNDNANACNYSPARVAAAITVGSTTNTDARSSFSNYGTCLDIFAPGSNITSAWYTSNTATNTISGTSMATPHVVGAAALYLQSHTTASPASVASALTGNATAGVVTGAGTGSPNLLLYVGTGTNPTPTPTPTPGGCGTQYSGSLSGTGAYQYQPNGTYYQSTVSGTHKGCLTGPSSADFDLYLLKWNGSAWATVASSLGSTSTETITYSGTSGYYMWKVYSYSGSGSYALSISHP